MSADQSMTYKAILEVIDQWPSAKRLTLVQDILHTLVPHPAKRRDNTLEKALGLLATSEPPPSDKEVDRWLNERRMEKYGPQQRQVGSAQGMIVMADDFDDPIEDLSTNAVDQEV